MKGILMKAEMVRAILRDDKTCTRRVMKPQPKSSDFHGCADAREYLGPKMFGKWGAYFGYQFVPSPYHVGETVYVKETWCADHKPMLYRATANGDTYGGEPIKWKSSLILPERLARIHLEITGVRAERVQDITEEDAKAEGIPAMSLWKDDPELTALYEQAIRYFGGGRGHYQSGFKSLWDNIHGEGAWERNNWVWVFTFKRVPRP